MKFLTSISALSLAVLLTACGGSDGLTDTTVVQTASVQTTTVAGTDPAAQGTPPTYGPNQPQPDCAPEGCNGLRIIDANAEAYRMDAMKRAEQEANQSGA